MSRLLSKTLQGLCLRSVNVQEAKRIATYFTLEAGLAEVAIPQARSSKGKQSGACELGHVFSLHVKPGRHQYSFYRLEQYDILNALDVSDTLSIETYNALFPILEMLGKLALNFEESRESRSQILKNYQIMLGVWKHTFGDERLIIWPALWFIQSLFKQSGDVPNWAWDVEQQASIEIPLQQNIIGYDTQNNGFVKEAHTNAHCWSVSKGVFHTLCSLEYLASQSETLALENLEQLPPVETLRKTMRFYTSLFELHHGYLKSLKTFGSSN